MGKGGLILFKSIILVNIFSIIIFIFSISFLISQIHPVSAISDPPSTLTIPNSATSNQGYVTITKPLTVKGVVFDVGKVDYISRDGSLTLSQGRKTIIATSTEVKAGIDSSGLNIVSEGATTPTYQGPLGITGGLGYLAQGLSTALLVVGGIQLVGGLLGLDDNQQEALSTAAGS